MLGLSGGIARSFHVRFFLLVQPGVRHVCDFQWSTLLLVCWQLYTLHRRRFPYRQRDA